MARARGKQRARLAASAREDDAAPAPPSRPTPPSPESTQAAEPLQPSAIAAWIGNAPSILGGVFILTFLIVAVRRLRYPFPLEWIESGLLDEVRWLASGHGLYVRPSLDYVPFVYNPLFFWVSAAASKLFGVSFFTVRLVSVAASVGTLGLLYKLVVAETKSPRMGIVGAGLFAATYKQTAQFMDVGRVDALFVFVAVASLWVLRTRRTRGGLAIAAGLLVLCFLAKQTGLLFAAPLVAFVLWDHAWPDREPGSGPPTPGRRLLGVPFAAFVAGGVALSVALLDRASDGWYRYYALYLPGKHSMIPASAWLDFWTADVLGPMGLAALGALFVLLGPSGMMRRDRALWGAALTGALVCSWAGRTHDGGWQNVLMPAYAILSALFAIGLGKGLELAARASPEARARLEVFLPMAATLQLLPLLYLPSRVVPTARDEAAGWRVVAALRASPGDTFTPTDSYLASLAGKRPHLHEMAAIDVFRDPSTSVSTPLNDEMRAAFRAHRWSMIITDNEFFADEVTASYERGADSVGEPDVLYPMTGVHFRPGFIYTPK